MQWGVGLGWVRCQQFWVAFGAALPVKVLDHVQGCAQMCGHIVGMPGACSSCGNVTMPSWVVPQLDDVSLGPGGLGVAQQASDVPRSDGWAKGHDGGPVKDGRGWASGERWVW